MSSEQGVVGSTPAGCTKRPMSQANKIKIENIPEGVLNVVKTIQNGGFEAYLVGGCVRDLILDRTPKDWDITTNATPEEIQGLFIKTVYENTFGTVAVIDETATDPNLKVIEVTPYRLESDYKDNRHPEKVLFSKDISDDLKRRDFTINAIAYDPYKGHLIDQFGGLEAIKDMVVRTVGVPAERFQEDGLRILRAIRFATELNFTIDYETILGITSHRKLLENISWERKRDEFTKIIMSPDPIVGIGLMQKLGVLEYVVPELLEGVGCEQKGEHIYDVFEHILHALGHAGEKKWPLVIRLSALFHDIGKPRTRRWDATKAGGKGKYTFYGHEVVGAKMTQKIMERLKYPKDLSNLVVKFVRYHMFFSDTETITLSAVRRTIANVGKENIWDLMEVRECDRVGMKKKEAPYRLRKYHAMIEEALRDPISVSQLKVDGKILMEELNIKAGPRMGWMLHALLEEVLDDPNKNTREYLDKRVGELDKLDDTELKTLGEKAKQTKEELEESEISKLHEKHGVKK